MVDSKETFNKNLLKLKDVKLDIDNYENIK